MSDIVERLRNWRTVHLARLHLLMEEAADEIERLRLRLSIIGDYPGEDNPAREDNESVRKTGEDSGQQPTLTDAERAAIAWCVGMAETTATECDKELAALRGLLARFE